MSGFLAAHQEGDPEHQRHGDPVSVSHPVLHVRVPGAVLCPYPRHDAGLLHDHLQAMVEAAPWREDRLRDFGPGQGQKTGKLKVKVKQ